MSILRCGQGGEADVTGRWDAYLCYMWAIFATTRCRYFTEPCNMWLQTHAILSFYMFSRFLSQPLIELWSLIFAKIILARMRMWASLSLTKQPGCVRSSSWLHAPAMIKTLKCNMYSLQQADVFFQATLASLWSVRFWDLSTLWLHVAAGTRCWTP